METPSRRIRRLCIAIGMHASDYWSTGDNVVLLSVGFAAVLLFVFFRASMCSEVCMEYIIRSAIEHVNI